MMSVRDKYFFTFRFSLYCIS